MKKLMLLILALPMMAQAQQWIALGGTSYNQYYVQEGSLRINGKTIAMTSQNVTRTNGRIFYMNSSTSVEACEKKQGTISHYALDNRAISQGVFALGGRDANSLIATAICATHYNYLLANPKNEIIATKIIKNVEKENSKETNEGKSIKQIKEIANAPQENADDVWENLASNTKSHIAIKADSFKPVVFQGQEMIGVTGRNIDIASKKVMLVSWYVSKSDCKQQQGKLYTTNIDGSNGYDNSFVAGSGSMGSIIAERICKQ